MVGIIALETLIDFEYIQGYIKKLRQWRAEDIVQW